MAETKVPSSPLSPGGDQEPQMAGHRRASACGGAQRPQLLFSAAWRRPQPRPRASRAWLGRPVVNGVTVGRAGEPTLAAAGKRLWVSIDPGSALRERAARWAQRAGWEPPRQGTLWASAAQGRVVRATAEVRSGTGWGSPPSAACCSQVVACR